MPEPEAPVPEVPDPVAPLLLPLPLPIVPLPELLPLAAPSSRRQRSFSAPAIGSQRTLPMAGVLEVLGLEEVLGVLGLLLAPVPAEPLVEPPTEPLAPVEPPTEPLAPVELLPEAPVLPCPEVWA